MMRWNLISFSFYIWRSCGSHRGRLFIGSSRWYVGTGSPTRLLLIRFNTLNSLFSATLYLNSSSWVEFSQFVPYAPSQAILAMVGTVLVHSTVLNVASLCGVYGTVFDLFHSCVMVSVAAFMFRVIDAFHCHWVRIFRCNGLHCSHRQCIRTGASSVLG